MGNGAAGTFVGAAPLHGEQTAVSGAYVELLGETYYRIGHYDQMPPFFISLVSSADHWLFISTTGGLTAGRRNADSALFPYETDDKIAAHSEQTGAKTLLRVARQGHTHLWEPFSQRYAGVYRCERHLYKNIYGNKLIFEEINHDLQLTFRYGWRTGDRFGFVKSSWLSNDSGDACHIDLLDGLQNLLPYGATSVLQTTFSNLLNGYKRNEVEPKTGLGLFALSATLTDRAEPSESLQATVAWQTGLNATGHLLSTPQIDAFRRGQPLTPERDVRGRAGAYLVHAQLTLAGGQSQRWHTVADVNRDSAAVVELVDLLGAERENLERLLEADIAQGTAALVGYVAAADGLQLSAESTTSVHHFANVLFNVMRGGIFVDGYGVTKRDLADFLQKRNRPLLAEQSARLATLPEQFSIGELYAWAADSGSPGLIRLAYEYLPLTFSRRHGDPSRPWNQFSINLRNPDGSPRLDYQGNWRDIFQNWEPLAFSFPAYIEGLIAKFLNATTADGYNPYRVTRDGIEWEVPEPHNPWANIGYWSDHQIIYLQKLLEVAEQVDPSILPGLNRQAIFAYAAVPYRLRPYEEMLADWYNTIDFDWGSEEAIAQAVAEMGTDGRLLRDGSGQVLHAPFQEKLLVLLLAKLTNLVPEGGIWMNTQRPEWNDANNALVGKGLSVVTAAYLRRFIAFWQTQMERAGDETFAVNSAVAGLLERVAGIFAGFRPHLDGGFDNRSRREVMDALGGAATDYRAELYAQGLPDSRTTLSAQAIHDFLSLAQAFIEQTLRANRRDDGLYHAYNILQPEAEGAGVGYLYPMLEGQVAILSAGLLGPDEALELLGSMRHSDLYRADQHSYMLYPDRYLPGFLEKNRIPAGDVAGSALVAALQTGGDRRLLVQDSRGDVHFPGWFRNANDAAAALDRLAQEPAYAALATAERDFVLDLFEKTFRHASFTGRSGTFFAFEGLGSIYWHMVAKLLLAVQENYFAALGAGADATLLAGLADAYYDIRQGLGFNKTPDHYGAFPTDPYSHTPGGSGARQPGMTGQVKEEILTRMGELGVFVEGGAMRFAPTLLRERELLSAGQGFGYVDVDGREQRLDLPAGSLAFTICQTPVVYTRGAAPVIEVHYTDGRTESVAGDSLDAIVSRHLFDRNGQVRLMRVAIASLGAAAQ